MKIRNSIECWILKKGIEGKKYMLLLHVPEEDGELAFWQPITGGIEEGESPSIACIREVVEETGIKLNVEQIKELEYKLDVKLERQGLLVKKTIFVSKLLPQNTHITISNEHDSFLWVELANVKQYLFWDSNIDTFNHVYEQII